MNRSAVTLFAAIGVVVAAVIFGTTLVRALWWSPDSEVPAPALAAEAPGKNVPTEHYPARLIIPKLDINSKVLYVGVNSKGNMAAPANFSDVAWYKYGPVPGQMGSAVVNGHVDNGLGLDGVFKHLGDLSVGDEMYIERKDGSRLVFVVSDVQGYPYKEVPPDLLFTRADQTRLNLITCEGSWLKADKTYERRLVVYTVYKQTIPTPEAAR